MAPRLKRREYKGEDIVVSYDIRRCIHAEECIQRLGAVYDIKKRPWIQPDEATADEVAEATIRCPSGALHYKRADGGAAEPIPPENTIVLDTDGPLYVKGDVEITLRDGSVLYKDTRMALCRCGMSNNKSFCDNTHKEIDFRTEDHSNVRSQTKEVETGGTLSVTPVENGPYFLRGNFEIRNEKGQVVFRGGKARLCRCGNSQSKPFCDGTHKKDGFSAESW